MTDYVATFMKTHAGAIDPSWQVLAREMYSETRRQKASARVQERTNSFKTLISTFAKNTRSNDLATFDVDRQFQWEDVWQVASEAIEQDKVKEKMKNNPFRAAGRSLQRNASNLEMLVQFLPNGDFTGILCGALTFVFCAAKRLDEVRNKIISCLESLPDIVQETQGWVDIYEDDPSVWKAAEDLYLGILDGIESMLHWIDKSALERAFKSLMKPMTYGKNVEEDTIKRSIEGNMAKFRNVVVMSQHRNMSKTLKSLKALYEQLDSDLKRANWAQENPKAEKLVTKDFVTLDELRSIIAFDSRINQKDMVTSMIDAKRACPPELIDHAMLALRSNAFNSWLQPNKSQILYINGRMKLNPEQEAASPLTVLSCILPEVVVNRSCRSLPLVYLCGQHNRPNDPYSGACSVLRCWSAQITDFITPQDVDLSEINYKFVEHIKNHQLEALCILFHLLLMSVRDKVVFIVLDGVSWLEGSRHVRGLELLVLFLRNLVNSLNQQQTLRNPDAVVIKVLITNPSTSDYARQWLQKECILEMDDVR